MKDAELKWHKDYVEKLKEDFAETEGIPGVISIAPKREGAFYFYHGITLREYIEKYEEKLSEIELEAC